MKLLLSFLLLPFGWSSAVPLKAQPLEIASQTTRTNLAAIGGSFSPSLSLDGRWAAFASYAGNLTTNDDALPYLDVFVRDLAQKRTLLASANLTGWGGGNGDSYHPLLSSNGQYLVFVSQAENLVTNDHNQAADLYQCDLISGTTELVSINREGQTSARRISSNPSMTPDGRWIVFQSTADDLAENAIRSEGVRHLYARDMRAGKTFLVSSPLILEDFSELPFQPASHSPAISSDGKRVVFVSTLIDLAAGVPNTLGDIYVRDLTTQTTQWLSEFMPAHPDYSAGYVCSSPAISADGEVIVFQVSDPANPSSGRLFFRDLKTLEIRELTPWCVAGSQPLLSASGRQVVYEARPGATEACTNVYVWDAHTGSNTLVNVSWNGEVSNSGFARASGFTPDGQTVAFLSTITNLVEGLTLSSNQACQLYVRQLDQGTTRLVSAQTHGEPTTRSLEGISASLSADGQSIAFDSPDDDLVEQDFNQASDVLVRDLTRHTTALVSPGDPSLKARVGSATGCLDWMSISADGRMILFGAYDNNLAAGDTNWMRDAFLHDRSAGTTTPGDVNLQGQFHTNYSTINPELSADGQHLLFVWRTNITGGVPTFQFYHRDLAAGTIERVDLQFKPAFRFPVMNAAIHPVISPEGAWVALVYYGDVYLHHVAQGASFWITRNYSGGVTSGEAQWLKFNPNGHWFIFQSQATNFCPGAYRKVYSGQYDLFACDLATKSNRLISIDAQGVGLPGNSAASRFSPNGRFLGFSGLYKAPGEVALSYVYDFQTHQAIPVCTNGLDPQPSNDGRWVAFVRPGTNTTPPLHDQVWLTDLQASEERLVSASLSGAPGNGRSRAPALSGDGRYLVFESRAEDLVNGDTNGQSDIFLYDRTANTTLLVSRNRAGTGSGNGPSLRPLLAGDGRTLVFQSLAGDLVAADYNQAMDVLVLRLEGGDTDGDGLPDDWEVTYFGNLGRDGAGDADGDGLSDRQEYQAGTDPASQGSVLRVLTLTPLDGGTVTLLWSSVPGKRYQVEYKDRVEEAWRQLGEPLTSTGATATAIDTHSDTSTTRFYRVRVVL